MFNDYAWMMRAAQKSKTVAATHTSDTDVKEVKLVHVLLWPNVRVHDVRKDDDWQTDTPLDPKYCKFRKYFESLKTFALQAELLSIWIISRSLALLQAFVSKKPKSSWPVDWLRHILPMSRDIGVSRESMHNVDKLSKRSR